jgi:hypothetical protein
VHQTAAEAASTAAQLVVLWVAPWIPSSVCWRRMSSAAAVSCAAGLQGDSSRLCINRDLQQVVLPHLLACWLLQQCSSRDGLCERLGVERGGEGFHT